MVRTILSALAVVCVVGASARAQSLVFSGANAKVSPGGGGSRSVLLVDGQYLVFFDDGTRVVYATTVDGVTFSAPLPASDSPANLGFSVARTGNTLGLVWASSAATGYSLWYREATISGASLAFGASTLVASHATDTRGYLATLSYSATGSPYIAALEFGQPYTGPIGPGCGSTTRYRPIHYFRQGGWQMRGYCNNFDTVRDPNSIAIAPSGGNMIVTSAIDANLSTAIVSDTAELGEPWHIVPTVDHVVPAQLSSAQSLTVATDLHLLFRDGAGAVFYGRQDGTLVGLNDQALDVTSIAAAARNPALSRPTTAQGCYVAAYTVGNTIRRRSFHGSVATLSPETVAYTTTTAATGVSIELDAANAPALVWQDGASIWFGVASAGGAATLTGAPGVAPADGMSKIAVSSTPFRDACGDPIPAGTLVTVTTSAGSIVDVDADAQLAGTQVVADAAGQISFEVRAPTSDGPARIAAMPVTGGTNATAQLIFGVPVGCGDGVVDPAAGEQCDSSGADTAECNAATCQLAHCGDGYVNAASEDCEAGALCDPTSCTFAYSLGGGCAGCGATRSSAGLWLVAIVGVAWRPRRRRRS